MTTTLGEQDLLGRMVDRTPPDRDRFVDLLRAYSILVVVLGHWMMAVIYMREGKLTGANAIEIVDGLWLATWVLQVMPLFFFVGGFSNAKTLAARRRRGEGYGEYLSSRIGRLLGPTMVFVTSGLAVAGLAELATPAASDLAVAASLVAKPLWFLSVYVALVAVAPVMLALHERVGVLAPVTMAAGAVVVDIARLSLGLGWVGNLNFVFVWLFAHQLGFFYADGTLPAWPRRRHLSLAGLGLTALVALTGSGIYSPSMVGADLPGASNNSPPTICLIALTLWLTGIAMAVRPWMSRLLARRGLWTAVVGVNATIMTIFLWHLTAALVAVLVLYPIGWPQPDGGTASWWALRPLWIGVCAIVLTGFVALFGRIESRKRGSTSGAGTLRTAGGIALVVAGLAGLASGGFRDVTLVSATGPVASVAGLWAGRVALGYGRGS